MSENQLQQSEPIIFGLTETDSETTYKLVASRFGLWAVALSLILNVWMLVTLNEIYLEPFVQLPFEPIESSMNEVEVPEELEQVVEYELANPDDRDLEVKEVINAASIGRIATDNPRIESAPDPIPEIIPTSLRHMTYDIPEGMEVDDRVVVKGTTGESLIQIESALDKVTWEIAQNLKEHKVLVIWMMDASASIIDQRKVVAKRLKRIYGELDALKNIGQVPQHDQPLLSAVVSFGEKTTYLTNDPTDKFDVIHDAILNAPTDPSGKENVFTAICQVTKRWSSYRAQRGRRIMLITLTDEAGDDFGPPLERAIALCRRYDVKTYVIGPTAPFGRRYGYVPYVAPENGKTYQLPVDLGPETAMIENVDLPFWYSGPQLTYLSSGYAPYALARVVKETGGIYFMSNMTTMAGLTPMGVYNSASLKPFEPDYSFGSIQAYQKQLGRYPLRRAVVNASILSRQYKARGTPQLSLRVTPQNFKQTATRAQEIVAESQLMLDQVLKAFPASVEDEFDSEPSLRWRMAYSLAYGRLLAGRVRAIEYNSALAWIKNELTPQDVGSKSNHWIFKPSNKIKYATSMRGTAKKATVLLTRVIKEAPGTPWAVMAQREMKDGLGIEIEQRFIAPPKPRPRPAASAAKRKMRIQFAAQPKKRAAPKKPAPKPKPPKLPKL